MLAEARYTNIGFVGLGAMGAPMARNLARLDAKIHVFDLRAEALEQAQSWGAIISPSLAELARQCDLVITMLPDDAALEAAVSSSGGIAEGAHEGMVLLDLSTIGPWTIEAVAGTLAPKGVVVRSGAVTLGVKAAIAGTLAVYLDKDVAEDPGLRPIVDAMAASVLATSGTGNAKIIKLINNLMVGVNVAATAEAFALAEKAGLPAEILHPLIMKGSGASFALANQIADAIAGEVGVGRFGTSYILKDLRIAMEMAKRSRHTMLFGAMGMAAYRGTQAMGLGAHYYPAVLRWMEHAAAVETDCSTTSTRVA